MSKTKYIQDVTTLEELKQVYKKLALKHHPDCGGDEEVMKAINNEYDLLFEKLKSVHKDKDDVFYTKETGETANEWRDIIHQLLSMKMQGVIIEVIGSFLWVSGNTKPYKEQLGKNGLGMRWSKNKSSWYLSPPGYRKFGKKKFGMNDIREMYGSERVNEGKYKQTKQLTGSR